ncbi:MAG: sigma-70 family RNA polymerase sigma factor [Gammaproteobacteria bacterium]|nr:sigma-70 family RNA polymerase sigma factor [Gammaproteobacteria bacterium]NNC76654.1 sigma-70 family RNA polymerase sigma factor [Woeseiaceae bacterium]
MTDEQQLVEQARAGSVPAFTELVNRYKERLLRFLLTRCASYADAEDALQDTFVNAYRYLNTYDARWRFSTWLYRIAVNNATRGRQADSEPLTDVADEGGDPLAECIAQSERENLWLSARRLLNDDVYTAMWLRYVEDMSIRDVAEVVGRSSAWTKVNLMRGRQALDEELNSHSENVSKSYG